MAKLSSKQLTVESFKEQGSWIGPLVSYLNTLANELISLFNNNISVSDNLDGEIKELEITNESNRFPIKVLLKQNKNPKCLVVAKVLNLDNSKENLTGTPFINWHFENGSIVIRSITNLTLNQKYRINILIINS